MYIIIINSIPYLNIYIYIYIYIYKYLKMLSNELHNNEDYNRVY